MSAPKIMAIRMGIYALLIGYLLLDLFVFKGPLKKTLTEPQLDTEAAIAEAKARGIVARVYYEPIFRGQVEERMKEYLWRRGRSIEETSFGERKMLRKVILEEMIDELLVKIQVKVSPIEDFAVDQAELEKAVSLEGMRLGPAFDELARRSGWQGEKELEMRLGARIQRENYFKSMIHAEVSEEEAKVWYEEHQEEMKEPSAIKIEYRTSSEGKDVFEGASTIEWIEEGKVSPEFWGRLMEGAQDSTMRFEDDAIWYEVKILGMSSGVETSFEAAKESIVDALTTYRRDEAWKKFRYERLRFRAKGNEVNKDKIQIFEENLVEVEAAE